MATIIEVTIIEIKREETKALHNLQESADEKDALHVWFSVVTLYLPFFLKGITVTQSLSSVNNKYLSCLKYLIRSFR